MLYKVLAIPLVPFYGKTNHIEYVLERYHNKGYKIVTSTYLEKYEYEYVGIPDWTSGGKLVVKTNIDKEIIDYIESSGVRLIDFATNEVLPTMIYTLIRTPIGKELYEDSETSSPTLS